jgi:hypothetical protein
MHEDSATRAPLRGVIKRERVHLDGARPQPVRPAAGREACEAPPRVRLLQREGGRAVIEFTCRCGEVSLLELQYEEKSC